MKPGRKKADGSALSASMWGNPGWDLDRSAWPRCQSWLKVGGMNPQKSSHHWSTQAGVGTVSLCLDQE